MPQKRMWNMKNELQELEAKLDVYHANLEHGASKMHNYIFAIKEFNSDEYIEQFNTDRGVEWTIKQYSRNRNIEYMNLIIKQ